MRQKTIENIALLEAQISAFLEDTTEPLPPERVMENPNFRKWFGNSVTVNADGTPMVFYHGTSADFKTFNSEKLGSATGNYGHYGAGFYFSNTPIEANTYAETIFGNVLAVYLKIINPFNASDSELLDNYAKDFGYKQEPVAIDVKWLMLKLKKIDPVAYELCDLIIKNGWQEGWNEFLYEKHNGLIPEHRIDLNTCSDWLEYINPKNEEPLPEWIIQEIEEYLGEIPKLINGYTETPQLKYMTDLGSSRAKDFSSRIQKDGYDGIIAGSEYIVFSPNQIKSIYNNGQFSTTSDNISEEQI